MIMVSFEGILTPYPRGKGWAKRYTGDSVVGLDGIRMGLPRFTTSS